MKRFGLWGGLLVAAAIVGSFGSAQAGPLAGPQADFQLNCGIGGGCSSANDFGTIQLSVVDQYTISVMVTLASGNIWVGSGAGDSLEFTTNTPITISNVTPAGSTDKKTSVVGFVVDNGSNITASNYGSFGYGVDFTGRGTSDSDSSVLQFLVTSTQPFTLSSFVSVNGNYFASDIGVGNSSGGFNTGNVASNFQTEVPEPAFVLLSLFGAGLIALAVTRLRARTRSTKEIASAS